MLLPSSIAAYTHAIFPQADFFGKVAIDNEERFIHGGEAMMDKTQLN